MQIDLARTHASEVVEGNKGTTAAEHLACDRSRHRSSGGERARTTNEELVRFVCEQPPNVTTNLAGKSWVNPHSLCSTQVSSTGVWMPTRGRPSSTALKFEGEVCACPMMPVQKSRTSRLAKIRWTLAHQVGSCTQSYHHKTELLSLQSLLIPHSLRVEAKQSNAQRSN